MSVASIMPELGRAVLGVGVDVVELERVRKIRSLRRFAEYFLSPSELNALEKSRDRAGFIASRFAAKEAAIKAFPGFLSPHDFEIVKRGTRPEARFFSPANARRYKLLVSVSHSVRYAAGCAAVVRK